MSADFCATLSPLRASCRRLRLGLFPYRFYAVAGGLMSYGVDTHDLYRRAMARLVFRVTHITQQFAWHQQNGESSQVNV